MVSKPIVLDLSIMYGKWSTWELTAPLYPNNSSIEFQDKRDNLESTWNWYPGSRPDESGEGGGSLLIAPYVTVNF